MDMTAAYSSNVLDQARSHISSSAIQGRTSAGINASNHEEIVASAKEFEAIFITQMLQQMFSGVEVDPVFGGGHAEETFRGILMEDYGKKFAESGGIGIAQHVQETLIRLQEV